MPVAAISAATSVIGGIAQSSAANKAASAQEAASQQNVAGEQNVLNTASGNLQPFVGAGQAGAGELTGLLGLGPNPQAAQSAFQNYLGSTNYNFLLNQGLQGQAFANAPNLNSGATSKALGNYAQGMAGNALQGYEGLLQNQEQIGTGAASALGQIGTNVVGQQAQARNLGAGAAGTSALYGANAIGSALSGVGNAFASSSFANPFASSGAPGNYAASGASDLNGLF
jgi:hypothetical protein